MSDENKEDCCTSHTGNGPDVNAADKPVDLPNIWEDKAKVETEKKPVGFAKLSGRETHLYDMAYQEGRDKAVTAFNLRAEVRMIQSAIRGEEEHSAWMKDVDNVHRERKSVSRFRDHCYVIDNSNLLCNALKVVALAAIAVGIFLS